MIFIQWSCMRSTSNNYISGCEKFRMLLSSAVHFFNPNSQYQPRFIKLATKWQTSVYIVWSWCWPNCQIQLTHRMCSIKSIYNIIIYYAQITVQLLAHLCSLPMILMPLQPWLFRNSDWDCTPANQMILPLIQTLGKCNNLIHAICYFSF